MNSNQPSRKKRRKLRGYHILIGLLLIGFGWFAAFRWRVRSELRARIDAIRAAGYPVTCAELDEWYSIPQGAENAAYVILDAISCYQDTNDTERELLPIVGMAELPARTEPLSEETMNLIRQYLAANKKALELLHKGAAIGHCRYPLNFGDGLILVLPQGIRGGGRRLGLEAVSHAENGRAAQAAKSVVSVFGIARSLAGEPIIISQLIRLASLENGAIALERVLNRVELTDAQLAVLGETITDAENVSGISCGLVGERCSVLGVFRKPESLPPDFIDGYIRIWTPALLQVEKALGLLDKGAIAYLDLMGGYIKCSQLPEHERAEAAKAVERSGEATGTTSTLLGAFMPAGSRFIIIELRRIALLRAARVGLAIERYRLAAGKLPDKLDELIPAYLDGVAKDPFDGEDLRYKRLDKGFVVYSIGEDGSDDGGKEKGKKSGENWDVTFIVER